MSLKVWPKWPDGGGSGDEEYLVARMIFGANIHPWMQHQTLDSRSKRRGTIWAVGNKHETCIFQIFISQDPIEFCYSHWPPTPSAKSLLLDVDWN